MIGIFMATDLVIAFVVVALLWFLALLFIFRDTRGKGPRL